MEKEEEIYCQHCGKKLNYKTALMLEMCNEDNQYYFVGENLPSMPQEISQGGFWFGKDCAKKVGRVWKGYSLWKKPKE